MFLKQLLKAVKESNNIPEPQVVLDRYTPQESADDNNADDNNADDKNFVDDVDARQEENVRQVPKRRLRTRKRNINYHE